MADINWGQFSAGIDPAQFAQQQNQDRLLRQNEAKARQDALEFQAKQAARAAAQVHYTKASDLYRTGDVRGAEAEFMAAGDKDMLTGTTSAGKQQFDERQAGLQAIGGFAEYVRKFVPLEHRAELIRTNRGMLIGAGADAEDVDAVIANPSDDLLGAASRMYYSPKDQDAAAVAQQGANTADMNAETARIVANNPIQVGGSLVTRGGQELFRAPEYINAPLGNNVYQVGGTQAQGYVGGPITAEQLYKLAIEPQESGGRAGVLGPMTRYGQAQGASQMLPSTAASVAKKLGIQWRPDLMTAKTPEGLAYQRQLGIGYAQEALDATGGDPRAAAMYYHGGPDRSIWGPKTQAYGQAIVGRLEKAQGVTASSRTPQLVQAGQAKPDANSTNKPLSEKDMAAASTKLAQVRRLKGQVVSLQELDPEGGKLSGAKPSGKGGIYSGMLGGLVPGNTPLIGAGDSDRYDTIVANVRNTISAITRIPGVGSQSDYEARLAAATMPERTRSAAGRAQAYKEVWQIAVDMERELTQQAQGRIGSAPQAAQSAPQAGGGRKAPPVGFRTRSPGGTLVEWTGSTWRRVG